MITLYKNLSQIVTMIGALEKDGRNLNPKDLSIIENGAIIFDENKIFWVGKTEDIPKTYKIEKTKDLKGHVLLPEIVDSHTHLIFGGNRATEYLQRINGENYETIAKNGGGILATMKGTQALSRKELFEICRQRIETIYRYGVGTIEIKSGYGLTYEKEKELSLIIDDLKKFFYPKVQIFNTFMAAHAVPKKFKNSGAYMKEMVIPLLEELALLNILDAVDIFHEKGYFNNEDVELLFKTAKKLKIPVKSHADEFYDNKGALLATRYKALSTDHLLSTDIDGIKALAKSSTVATLLPGTGFFLGKSQANARAFLDAGVKVAIASDYNPGSCHCDNLLLITSFIAPQYKMNIAEIWASMTLNASHALGLKSQGAIKKGLLSRYSIFKTNHIDEITYSWGKNLNIRDNI